MAENVPTWVDGSAGGTPLSAKNLNQDSIAIRDLDARVTDEGFDVAKDYGADPTGVADSYTAIKNAVAAINTAGKGTLVFPPGTYKIDQYKITGGVSANTVTDITFQNCNGLRINGYGAIINVKGNFNRAADQTATLSYEQAVCPFLFINCTNFELCGFELNGNVQLMTRANSGVTEPNSASGVITNKCSQYSIHHMNIHHFSNDGLTLGTDTANPCTADKQVLLHNIKSTFNARQGISFIQVRGATVISCEFSETGNSAGTYGTHSPSAGVDIEPNYSPTSSPASDVKTGLISFMECKFKNNVGSQFGTIYANLVEKVRLRDCEIIAGTSTNAYPLILSIDGGVIENSVIDTGGNYIYPTWSAPFNALEKTTISNCEIRSPDRMIQNVQNTPVTISGCRFIGTGAAVRANTYPIYIQNTMCVFRDNYVFLPAAEYNGGPSGNTWDQALLVQNIRLARDNLYETDMSPAASQHFTIAYASSKTVQNETFLSAGNNTGFRPDLNSTWDNTFPYSLGYGSVGASVVTSNLDTAGYNTRIVTVQAMPSTGSWHKGDVAINANPTKSGKIGWTRLTTGSGNVLNTDWQPFGPIDP